ncbi:MAG TPA: hypothetical protein VKM55_13040, partial [Candidatus Lokiarchaeia archaeon]|nr:hypothetical protein [Candidatus Lokiarchaeia archaeon]
GFNGLFFMISSASNLVSVHKQWESLAAKEIPKNTAFMKVMKTQLIRGGFIWIFGWISEGLLASLLGLATGDSLNTFGMGLINGFYFSNVLQTIGTSIIFSSLVYLIILKFDISRARACYIFATIAIAVIVFQPLIRAALRATPWSDDFSASNITAFLSRGVGINILLFIGAPFVGRLVPLVPYFSCAAIGAIIAVFINQKAVTPEVLQKLFAWGFIIAGIGILIGVVLNATNVQPFDIDAESCLGWFLLLLGGETSSTAWLLYMIDFRKKTRVEVFIKRTVTLRRFGLLTLTLWTLQYFMAIPVVIIELITGWPALEGNLNEWQLLIVLGLLWLMWHLILWLWEKVNFKGSFEWMNTLLLAKGTTTGDRLKVDETLYHPERMIEWVPGKKARIKEEISS